MLIGTRDTRNGPSLRNADKQPRTLVTSNRAGRVDTGQSCLADARMADSDLGKTTTDDQIVDLVYQSFRASGYGQFRQLKVYCDHGRVTLQGSLPTYYLKQVAQTVIRLIPGIRDIDNDVTVPRHNVGWDQFASIAGPPKANIEK